MIKNPEMPLRTAYIQALSGIQPTWSGKVPKNVSVPNKYTLIGTQTKNPTEKGKDGCMEWICTIVIDLYNLNIAGYSAKGVNDVVEEQVINIIEAGIDVDGFRVNSIDFIDSKDLSIETPTQSIERRVITYQHWLAQL